jgi:carboxymethylenebutenolidase
LAAHLAPPGSTTPDCAPARKLCREEDFARAHHADVPVNGEWTHVGGQRAYLSLPTVASAPMAGVLLLHSARGLDNNMQLWSDRLSEEGYAVLAVDFYEGKVANNDPDAFALRDHANANLERNLAAAKAAYAMLSSDPRVQAPRVALVGWSFGGAWVTYLATELPDVAAVVTYAGSAIHDAETAKRIRAPVLMVRGSRDDVFDADAAAKLEARLKSAQKRVELVEVEGGHAFADPTRTGYSAAGDWAAFVRVRHFLRTHLTR